MSEKKPNVSLRERSDGGYAQKQKYEEEQRRTKAMYEAYVDIDQDVIGALTRFGVEHVNYTPTFSDFSASYGAYEVSVGPDAASSWSRELDVSCWACVGCLTPRGWGVYGGKDSVKKFVTRVSYTSRMRGRGYHTELFSEEFHAIIEKPQETYRGHETAYECILDNWAFLPMAYANQNGVSLPVGLSQYGQGIALVGERDIYEWAKAMMKKHVKVRVVTATAYAARLWLERHGEKTF